MAFRFVLKDSGLFETITVTELMLVITSSLCVSADVNCRYSFMLTFDSHSWF